MYAIRQATTSNDAHTALGILKESVDWLAETGSDQWQHPEFLATGRMLTAVDLKRVWLLRDGSQYVATVTIAPGSEPGAADPDFWTPDDRPERAVYVSKLAVARSHRGREIGAKLLEFARHWGHEFDFPLVRLDAWRTNVDLHRYYLSRGWRRVRVVTRPGRRSGALFERDSGWVNLYELGLRVEFGEAPVSD